MNSEYICRRAPVAPRLDGRLDHPAWYAAEKSPRFVDMVSGEPGFYDTRAAALWDDAFLYVAFLGRGAVRTGEPDGTRFSHLPEERS